MNAYTDNVEDIFAGADPSLLATIGGLGRSNMSVPSLRVQFVDLLFFTCLIHFFMLISYDIVLLDRKNKWMTITL